VFELSFTKKTLGLTILFALLISLFSACVGWGRYGGMLFFEYFGWPTQYYWVMRDLEIKDLIPEEFSFDSTKFILNTLYWLVIPIFLMAKPSKHEPKYKLFISLIIVAFIIITAVFSYQNSQINSTRESNIPSFDWTKDGEVNKKKAYIEKAYPELRGIENSFAGGAIKVIKEKENHYFAYITYGSGIGIVKAECFKVDSTYEVIQTGSSPDRFNPYYGYADVNPKDCKGIK